VMMNELGEGGGGGDTEGTSEHDSQVTYWLSLSWIDLELFIALQRILQMMPMNFLGVCGANTLRG